MKGISHIILSLLTLLVILAPLTSSLLKIEAIPALILIFLGVFIGSITPDIDKGSGSAIFHSEIPGAKGKKFHLTPIFGYTIYYTCYKPIQLLFRVIFGKKIYAKQGHRELPHSPIGVILISMLLTFYIWIIFYALSQIPAISFIYNKYLIFTFGAAFLLGCFMHLVEDTCDNSGIHYFYPFSFSRLRGTLKGDGKEAKPRIYALILLLAAAGLCTASVMGSLPAQFAYPACLFAPIVLWMIFLRISGVPAKKQIRE